jgi:hypothetical protein
LMAVLGFRVAHKLSCLIWEWMTKNSSFLHFRSVFVSYCP